MSFGITPLLSGQRRWKDVVDYYHGFPESFRSASEMRVLAEHICRSPMCEHLSVWTSMMDLCVAQGACKPYEGVYLRISPLGDGHVQFRYIDTYIKKRQWVRRASPGEACLLFEKMVKQLNWLVV